MPSITTLVALEVVTILRSAKTNSTTSGTTMTILAFHPLLKNPFRVEPPTSYSTVGELFVLSEVNRGKRLNWLQEQFRPCHLVLELLILELLPVPRLDLPIDWS